MKINLTPLAISLSLAFATPALAEDFIPQQTDVAPALEAVAEATEQPFQQEAITEETFVSAEEQVREYLNNKGWPEGWDDKKKRLFVIHSESFDSEDPSYDDTFVTKRSLYASIAIMGAKAKMVEYMRTQMSAVDQISAPGTDVNAELNQDYNKLERKLEVQQRKLLALLAEVDRAEAEKLQGVAWKNRAEAFADAVINRIDASYQAGELEQAKAEKFEKAKTYFNDAIAEMDSLKKKAKEIKDSISLEAKSSVETLARAPIMGATVLVQAESWNAEEEKYQVASLVVWSEKLEKAAIALQKGEKVELKPKKGLTVHEWLKKQDPATLAGPRQYVDKNGERWFIGSYAMPIEGSSSLERKNKNIADMMAMKEAVISLYADVETKKQAEIALQTRKSGEINGKDTTKVATSFAETTRQSIENKQVRGNQKLFAKTLKHPISNQKIYVAAYGISQSSALSALGIEKSANDAATSIGQLNAANQSSKTTKAVSNGQSVQKTVKSSKTLISAPEIDEDDF